MEVYVYSVQAKSRAGSMSQTYNKKKAKAAR